MSACIILETDAGSTSICIFLAPRENCLGSLVILSSNLAPIAIIKSALCMAIFA